MKVLEFSELLMTKFCHDVSGQISAVDNGLEFLKEGNEEIKEKAMEIVSSSSAGLVTKISFYRYAYGCVKHSGEADMEQLYQLIKKFYQDSKIKVIWHYKHNQNANLRGITNQAGKLLLNLIILISSYLLHGGTIEIKIEKGKVGKLLQVIAHHDEIKLNSEHQAIIVNNEQPEINLFNVQTYLTKQIANEVSANLEIKHNKGYITFSAEFAH